jgi:hypothetical protein
MLFIFMGIYLLACNHWIIGAILLVYGLSTVGGTQHVVGRWCNMVGSGSKLASSKQKLQAAS